MKTQTRMKLFKITILALWISISFLLASAQTAPVIQWQNTIGGNDYDLLQSVIQTIDGGYLLGGYSASGNSGDKIEANQGNEDYWVVKLDESGNNEWQNTIGGNSVDELFSVIPTMDGGYLLGGNSDSGLSGDKTQSSQGGSDYWVVKLDSSGNIEWENTIGGSSDDYLRSVIKTTDGGYLLGGYSHSDISGDKTEVSHGETDYWVVKLNGSGNIEWQNTIGGNLSDLLRSVIQTSDGGYLLGGDSFTGISGDKTEAKQGENDYWVVKLNGSGNIEWQNTIGGNSFDYLRSVIQADDGYLLGGNSESGISGDKSEESKNGDYWVLKLDNLGNIEWQNTIGGNISEVLYSVIPIPEGGYLLGGSSFSDISGDKTEANQGGNDYWVVKLNDVGSIEWQNTIGGSLDDYLRSVIQTNEGGYLLGGYSLSGISGDKTEASQGSYDYWVVKLSAEGVVDCQVPTSLSANIVTPTTATLLWDAVPGAVGYRVMYKAEGFSQWSNTLATNNQATITELTPNTKYSWKVRAVCSQSQAIYSDSSAEERFTTAPMRLGTVYESIFEVHPNPISQLATVSFSLYAESSVVIQIMDVNGKSLKVIDHKKFTQGSHEVTFNRESLPAGIYFLQLKTNEGVMIKKLVIE